MGFLDRIFGSNPAPHEQRAPVGTSADDQAIARYRYLLRTAPPEAVEQAHTEAFAQLTPEQRAEVLRQLSAELPASERAGAPQHADPQALARMATRAELRQPGFLERVFGARGFGPGGLAPGGVGLGGMMAGTLLSSIAGTFIGSAIAHQFLDGFDSSPEAGHDNDQSGHGLTDHDQHADNSGDATNQDADDTSSGDDDVGGEDYGDGDFGGDDFDV
jgi:hypothetical protein